VEGRWGAALKSMNAQVTQGGGSDKTLWQQRIDLLTAMEWDNWAAYFRTHQAINFPKSYTLF